MTFAALSHPSLQDCRRMFLRNYEVQINIGVHDFEKKGEQRVLAFFASALPRLERRRQRHWWVHWRQLIYALALLLVSGLGHLADAGELPWRDPWDLLGRQEIGRAHV